MKLDRRYCGKVQSAPLVLQLALSTLIMATTAAGVRADGMVPDGDGTEPCILRDTTDGETEGNSDPYLGAERGVQDA